MKATEKTIEVDDVGLLPDNYEIVREDPIAWNSQGLHERVTLDDKSIEHLKGGGIIMVPINGEEYCLLICYRSR